MLNHSDGRRPFRLRPATRKLSNETGGVDSPALGPSSVRNECPVGELFSHHSGADIRRVGPRGPAFPRRGVSLLELSCSGSKPSSTSLLSPALSASRARGPGSNGILIRFSDRTCSDRCQGAQSTQRRRLIHLGRIAFAGHFFQSRPVENVVHPAFNCSCRPGIRHWGE